MPNDMLEDRVKKSYEDLVSNINATNEERERQYFSDNLEDYMFKEVLKGRSFNDCYNSLKKEIESGDISKIALTYAFLNNEMLYSYRDRIFKTKLKADNFVSTPIYNLIYPLLLKKIKEIYIDSSDISEEEIKIIICTFIDLQSLLFILYYHDFQFIPDWEKLYPNTYQDIIHLLKESGMTIGDFLHALVDYKCDIMADIFEQIQNETKKKMALNIIKKHRLLKHKEVNGFSHITIPIINLLEGTVLKSDENQQITIETKKGILNN